MWRVTSYPFTYLPRSHVIGFYVKLSIMITDTIRTAQVLIACFLTLLKSLLIVHLCPFNCLPLIKDYLSSGLNIPSFGFAICQDKQHKEISINLNWKKKSYRGNVLLGRPSGVTEMSSVMKSTSKFEFQNCIKESVENILI